MNDCSSSKRETGNHGKKKKTLLKGPLCPQQSSPPLWLKGSHLTGFIHILQAGTNISAIFPHSSPTCARRHPHTWARSFYCVCFSPCCWPTLISPKIPTLKKEADHEAFLNDRSSLNDVGGLVLRPKFKCPPPTRQASYCCR